jgi:hypothetical protein
MGMQNDWRRVWGEYLPDSRIRAKEKRAYKTRVHKRNRRDARAAVAAGREPADKRLNGWDIL